MAKVVCFDFDDVLTSKDEMKKMLDVFGHTFSELRYGLDILEDNRKPKKFFSTMKKMVAMGRGMKYERLERISDLLRPNNNAKSTLKKLKGRKYKIVIVSINDENIIRKFLKKNGMDRYVDHIYASKIGVKNGLMTGEILGDVVKTEKLGVVNRIMKMYGAKKGDISYIGDGLTDLPIMKKIGRGILFCPNPVTNAEALTDRDLMKMKRQGRLFLVEEKDLEKVLDFIE